MSASGTRGVPRALWGLLAAGLCGIAAWWPVTTRQGVNGQVAVIRLPLWVKTAEFLIRDYHDRRLAHEIVRGVAHDQEKVMALLAWTRAALHPQPPDLPVVDDHVYSIIVRGYGAPDQFADVLATLCVYAGIPAVRNRVTSAQGRRSLSLTLVRVEGRWCPIDPYHGVYFQHPDGRLLSWPELAEDPVLVRSAYRGPVAPPVEYGQFIRPGISLSVESPRPSNQIPWVRVWQEITHMILAQGRS